MSYASAYGIRIVSSEQEMARPSARRCRRRILDLLASAVFHRRDARARDVCIALSAAGGPRHVRQRGDGDGGGADLARTARAPPCPAPAGRGGGRGGGGSRPR